MGIVEFCLTEATIPGYIVSISIPVVIVVGAGYLIWAFLAYR